MIDKAVSATPDRVGNKIDALSSGSLNFVSTLSVKVTEENPKYREISILSTCYKIYSKILNMKLQKNSEVFMTNTKWIPKGAVMHGPNILP